MPVKKSVVSRFKLFRNVAKPEFKDKVDEVIRLYENRNIAKQKTAETLLRKLVGNKPQSAISQLTKYSNRPSETGRLSRPTAATLSKKSKKFFISGKIKTTQTWTETRRGKVTEKTMESKTIHPFAQTIEAKDAKEAVDTYKQLARNDFSIDGYHLKEEVDDNGVEIVKVVDITQLNSTPTKQIKMKAAKPFTYEFIPNDDSLDKNEGFCVPDQFVGFYGHFIKKLTIEYFNDLCRDFYGVNPLDEGIEGLGWTMRDGVCPECLTWICEKLNISTYGYDVTKKCFIKHVAKSRNYPALVYYAVNQHMYWISNQDEVYKLVRRARDIEVNIKSELIKETEDEKTKKETRKNIYKELTILENIPVQELDQHKNTIVIYSGRDSDGFSKTNLNQELDQIIQHFNYVPDAHKMKYSRFKCTRLHFNKDGRNVILEVDPNDQSTTNWKDVKALCEKNNIDFRNQTLSALVKEMRDRFYDSKSLRVDLTAEKEAMHKECNQCTDCKKKTTVKGCHLDHIVPLACGGDISAENLQLLCKKCHFAKTKEEHENGYVKLSQTHSSFNQQTFDIFNSSLSNVNAFVENVEAVIDKPSPKQLKRQQFHPDINKCR